MNHGQKLSAGIIVLHCMTPSRFSALEFLMIIWCFLNTYIFFQNFEKKYPISITILTTPPTCSYMMFGCYMYVTKTLRHLAAKYYSEDLIYVDKKKSVQWQLVIVHCRIDIGFFNRLRTLKYLSHCQLTYVTDITAQVFLIFIQFLT